MDLVDCAVVGDEKALEAKLVLENFREQALASCTLYAVPTAIRWHDRADAGVDGRDIRGKVEEIREALDGAEIIP